MSGNSTKAKLIASCALYKTIDKTTEAIAIPSVGLGNSCLAIYQIVLFTRFLAGDRL